MWDFESNANPPEAYCVGLAQPRVPPFQCNCAVQHFAEIPQLVQKLKLHNPTDSRLASRAKCYDAKCNYEVSKASNATVQTRIAWLSAWLCQLFLNACVSEAGLIRACAADFSATFACTPLPNLNVEGTASSDTPGCWKLPFKLQH